jgi:hypothetical protein
MRNADIVTPFWLIQQTCRLVTIRPAGGCRPLSDTPRRHRTSLSMNPTKTETQPLRDDPRDTFLKPQEVIAAFAGTAPAATSSRRSQARYVRVVYVKPTTGRPTSAVPKEGQTLDELFDQVESALTQKVAMGTTVDEDGKPDPGRRDVVDIGSTLSGVPQLQPRRINLLARLQTARLKSAQSVADLGRPPRVQRLGGSPTNREPAWKR